MTSCVYVVEAIDHSIKVGQSSNFEARLSQLKCAHGPLVVLARFLTEPSELRRLEARALSLMRWWNRAGEWHDSTRWSRQLVADWIERGEIHCPKWLHWIDLDTKEPLPDWESRPDTAPQDDEPRGWLFTGADRLMEVPMSLRPWSGPENRSKFGAKHGRRLRVVEPLS